MLNDIRGVPVTSSSAAAVSAYDDAVTESVLYVGDPIAACARALELDSDLILGHTLNAMYNLLGNTKQSLPEALGPLEKSESLAATANPRELGHIAAVRAWYEGDFAGSSLHWDRVLVDYPRDLFALQMGHLLDFYTGNAFNLRDRIARVLPAWDDSLPGRDVVSGMYAFGLEESGDYRRAEKEGRRAIDADSRDSWAAHAVAHVMEMEGRREDGDAWLTQTSEGWAPGNFTVHNWWHLALFRLDLGDLDGVLHLYDTKIRYEGQEFVEEILDCAALLWRLELIGVGVGDRWENLTQAWLPLASEGRYAFNDMHAMMCFARTGRRAEAESVIVALEREAGGDQTTSTMAREIGLPVCRGILAFEAGNYDQVVNELLPIRYDTRIFGGSHAQRDVIAQTLILGAIRSGHKSLARALLAERAALKEPTEASFTARAMAEI